jgi:ABC-type ATPase with predicted acetyltransferase domain
MGKHGGLTASTENERKVRRWFGVEAIVPNQRRSSANMPQPPLAPGTITLITGPSGAGKSTLLRQLRRRNRDALWIDVTRVPLPNARVVDCFQSDDLESILAFLGRVGLAEVWTYLRMPNQLSDGQRLRLRWALALWQAYLLQDAIPARRDNIPANSPPLLPRKSASERMPLPPLPPQKSAGERMALPPLPPQKSASERVPFPPLPPGEGRGEGEYDMRSPANPPVILSSDEFCSILDTVTARILSRCLRKSIDAHRPVAAVLATARSDLEPALRPDVTVRCDFGECAVA